MNILAFDIEANGLRTTTQVHCGVVENIETGERHEFTNGLDLYAYLLTADRVICHNGRMYDCPTLERLVGRPNNLPPLPPCFDTVLVSRLLWSDKGNTPANGHSLEKWGEFLKVRKAHAGIEDWSVFTPEMLERCHSDVDIQVKLYHYLLPKLEGWGESVQIEHTVASIIQKQIENGFPIDLEALQSLEHTLNMARLEAMDSLSHIEPWIEEEEMKKPAYWYNPFDEDERYPTKGEAPSKVQKVLVRGPNWVKRTEVPFNPNSRDHIIRLFKEKYGWKHDDETPTGKPKVDEKVLSSLDYPEAVTLSTILMLDKRLSQVEQWKKYEDNGRVHGDVITNGTVTGRMSHARPNMAQIPKVGSDFGSECRACFKARDGWVLVGADASGLELRMLAHYMSKWDGGAYVKIILEGDVHTANQQAAGLPTRDNAKTFIYGWLYGAGDQKIGEIVGRGRSAGRKLKKDFLTSMPALRKLMEWVKSQKELTGLDGRKYPIRSDHMALNTLLQGAGAVLMKKALCLFYEMMVEKHGPHGERWALCANIHDEQQVECEEGIAEDVGTIFVLALKKAGEHFKLGIPIDGEYKIGKNWAETH